MDTSRHISPSLCAYGCGFFGSTETRNLCSKCYKDFVKEMSAMAAQAPSKSSSPLSSPKAPPEKERCRSCNKKVGLTGGFKCRCGDVFCGLHRYPTHHSCTFDFKVSGRHALAKENPVCKADKLPWRV